MKEKSISQLKRIYRECVRTMMREIKPPGLWEDALKRSPKAQAAIQRGRAALKELNERGIDLCLLSSKWYNRAN